MGIFPLENIKLLLVSILNGNPQRKQMYSFKGIFLEKYFPFEIYIDIFLSSSFKQLEHLIIVQPPFF